MTLHLGEYAYDRMSLAWLGALRDYDEDAHWTQFCFLWKVIGNEMDCGCR